MDQGTIGSMRELGVTESYKLKRQVILSASEAAEMIIRYVLLMTATSSLLDYLLFFQGG
jgi:T-complex protein 1 subunit beta